MQWLVGPKRQNHAQCGRTVKLSRGFSPPVVERGVLVEPVVPWWHLPGTGLPFDLGEADYLGGHSIARKRINGVTVEMQAEQIRVSVGIRAFVVPWSDVRGVHADTYETLLERPVVHADDRRQRARPRSRPGALLPRRRDRGRGPRLRLPALAARSRGALPRPDQR